MTEFSQLAVITEMLLEKELETVRAHRREIAALNQSLAQMDAMREAALADQASVTARQRIGADALWQGWLVKKRAELLRGMALAQAREGDSLARARTAFSRAQAAEALVEDDRRAAQQKRLKAEADRLEDLGILRRAMLGDP